MSDASKIVQFDVPFPKHLDLFCSGHARLADGNLLVGGGTTTFSTQKPGDDPHHGHFRGARWTVIFDWLSSKWKQVGDMVPNFDKDIDAGGNDVVINYTDAAGELHAAFLPPIWLRKNYSSLADDGTRPWSRFRTDVLQPRAAIRSCSIGATIIPRLKSTTEAYGRPLGARIQVLFQTTMTKTLNTHAFMCCRMVRSFAPVGTIV